MKIYIDGQELDFFQSDDSNKENIVQVAKKHGIVITSPCFLTNSGLGCCASCVIEVDGEEAYACTTIAKDGMKIKYNDPILREKRSRNLKKYKEKMEKQKKVRADHLQSGPQNIDLNLEANLA